MWAGAHISPTKDHLNSALSSCTPLLASHRAATPSYTLFAPHRTACLWAQAALTKSIKELQRGQVGTLLDWSKRIYRGGAWSYGVAHAYTHPWVSAPVIWGSGR